MKHLVRSTLAAAAFTVISLSSYAQAGAPFTIQQATARREVSISGKPDAHGHKHGHDEVNIQIVWKSATPPAAIFYRADAAHWLKCKPIQQEKRAFGGGPNDFAYLDRRTTWEAMKAGETYILRPEEMPSEVQPNEVKSKPTGAIFYQMGNSRKWQFVKVKLKRLPDLKRP